MRVHLVEPLAGKLPPSRLDQCGSHEPIAEAERIAIHVKEPEVRQERDQIFGRDVPAAGQRGDRCERQPVVVKAPNARMPSRSIVGNPVICPDTEPGEPYVLPIRNGNRWPVGRHCFKIAALPIAARR